MAVLVKERMMIMRRNDVIITTMDGSSIRTVSMNKISKVGVCSPLILIKLFPNSMCYFLSLIRKSISRNEGIIRLSSSGCDRSCNKESSSISAKSETFCGVTPTKKRRSLTCSSATDAS